MQKSFFFFSYLHLQLTKLFCLINLYIPNIFFDISIFNCFQGTLYVYNSFFGLIWLNIKGKLITSYCRWELMLGILQFCIGKKPWILIKQFFFRLYSMLLPSQHHGLNLIRYPLTRKTNICCNTMLERIILNISDLIRDLRFSSNKKSTDNGKILV